MAPRCRWLKTTFLASGVVILLLAETGAVCAQAPTRTDRQDREETDSASSHPLVGTRAGEERDDNGLKMTLVWCPAGTFTMGSPESEEDRDDDERQRQIALPEGFWLGKYEVTQAEWKQVMGTTPWKEKERVQEGPRYAASFMKWGEMRVFLKRLTHQERQAGRLPERAEYTLPTEAQWEYACRAGTKTAFSFGESSEAIHDYAWFHRNAMLIDQKYAHEVGAKKPNAWGFHDLHGNVWEACLDVFEKKSPIEQEPLVSLRVYRGGAWYGDPYLCRSANRGWLSPDSHGDSLGFRVALIPGR